MSTLETTRSTPQSATAFEREQLRFLMTQVDVAATLANLNPSLAWLPVLAELQLINANVQLAPWIEKNFHDHRAVSEVAAGIHLFGPETAELLEFRLNRAEELSPLLERCWRLIIRCMSSDRRIALHSEWYDIAQRIKRGDQSSEVLERLADALRPRLKIGRPLRFGEEYADAEPKHPADFMSIDYVVSEGIDSEEILSAWSSGIQTRVAERLLTLLTNSLIGALEDAKDVGLEGGIGSGLSDFDVPSVARHGQNTYREGFQSLVRAIADTWTELAKQDPTSAQKFVDVWRAEDLRLLRRLALFSAANSVVAESVGFEILLNMPSGELFLTGSSVEVCRLLEARWQDFSSPEQRAIQERLAEGPPADWFLEEGERHIERCRFDLLGHLERIGVTLCPNARSVLDRIKEHWPEWKLRPKERAGFHIWHESSSGVIGDPRKLEGVADQDLVNVAVREAQKSDPFQGDAWAALCQTDTERAWRGLAADASAGRWEVSAWHDFLWTSAKEKDEEVASEVARALLESTDESFAELAKDVAWWLNQEAGLLPDSLLWRLWDRIFGFKPRDGEDVASEDILNAAINHPAGWLAEVVLKWSKRCAREGTLSEDVHVRLDKLVEAPGSFGRMAKATLAREVSFIFEYLPVWAKEKLIPLFHWSNPDAGAVWSARRYANYIGSPELFGLLKEPFLELFSRRDISRKELQTYADWLVAISIANQDSSADYPVTFPEIRAALRKSGVGCLSSVGHRLAIEMGKAPTDGKVAHWRTVVGPVFKSIWPLDVELQTSASTFQLVHVLRASGSAFPEAVDSILPFIRSETPGQHSSVYALANTEEVLYTSSPVRMLDLLVAVVGDSGQGAYGLERALERITAHAPELRNSKKFQKLLGYTK